MMGSVGCVFEGVDCIINIEVGLVVVDLWVMLGWLNDMLVSVIVDLFDIIVWLCSVVESVDGVFVSLCVMLDGVCVLVQVFVCDGLL